MTVESVITSVLGTEDFARYEQNLYEKYQDRAERELIAQLNELLSNGPFLMLLKQWSARCACRFFEYREITVRLKSEKLMSELELSQAKQILGMVKKLIADTLKLSDKQSRKLSKQVRELLWHGDINGIEDLVRDKLAGKRKAPKAALKKLNDYFGDHARFQYQTFRDNGLPTGSGTVESAIRRVINLRIKGTRLFWKREHAENIIFLRSLVLTGKLKNACRTGLGLVRNMFDNNTIENLPLVA